MTDIPQGVPETAPVVPPDDPARSLTLVDPDASPLHRLGLAGDTYTILLTGENTAGRYCLIDMHVPPGGGPPLHRHDFEEMFTVLEGQIELTFRGRKITARAGQSVNVPANAPHAFTNASDRPARMLCVCAPAGQEEFFLAIGVPLAGRTTPPPRPSKAEQEQFMKKAKLLAPVYRTELFLEP